MNDWKLGVVEARFADIIWQNEPVTAAQLSAMAEKELRWKRTRSLLQYFWQV